MWYLRWVDVRRLRVFTVLAFGVLPATGLHAANSAITALVSCPRVPPGGTAQITVMLPAPVAFTHGHFQIELDPGVFGAISAVNVFSASGDQQGVAALNGVQAEVEFGAESGGIGRLPNLPVAEITALVLPTALAGATGAVTVRTVGAWYEISGRAYDVAFQSPGVPVGAGLSIRSVMPGGGPLAAGTVVAINGQGFTTSTKLQLDGVAWSSLQMVSPSLLNITLTGPADLAGKLFRLTDTGGATRYWSDLTPASVTDETNSGYWPIFPVVKYERVSESSYANYSYWWLENDTASPIDVTFGAALQVCTPCGKPDPAPSKKITVPAGGLYLTYFNAGAWQVVTVGFTASAPIRVLHGFYPQNGTVLSDISPTALSPADSFAPGLSPFCPGSTVDYRIGDPPPASIACDLTRYNSNGMSITEFSAGTDDGNPWLQASPVAGSAAKFMVAIDPRGLPIGTHTGMLTASFSGSSSGTVYGAVTLNVHAAPVIAANTNFLLLDVTSSTAGTITITSNGPPVPITVSSDSWMTVTPSSAVTPAVLNVSIAPQIPAYMYGQITIQGPANNLAIVGETSMHNGLFGNAPGPVFLAKAGSTAVMTSSLTAYATFDLKGTTGGNWLNVSSSVWALTIQADPSGLPAGVYRGTIIATPTGFTEPAVTIPVTLSILGDSTPPPVATPSSVVISPFCCGRPLNVLTGSMPLPFSVAYDASGPVRLSGPTSGITPATLGIGASPLYPGTYQRSLTITSPPDSGNSVYVPVTVIRPATPVVDPIQPRITAIVNAGSMLPGAIAPGEIVSVFGLVQTVGNAVLHTGRDGTVNRALYGIRVLFNGIAAPLTFLSASQINAVVPYEIAGGPTVTVEIDGGGVHSAPSAVPLAPTAPGLFTQDGTGQGSAAILNQDSTVNGPANPAARGSTIQIFLTGEGATNPPGITGEVTGTDIKVPILGVTVQIGGEDANVISATTAPGAIAGLFQVDAVVPAGAPSGLVPVVVQVGTQSSPAATVSVE